MNLLFLIEFYEFFEMIRLKDVIFRVEPYFNRKILQIQVMQLTGHLIKISKLIYSTYMLDAVCLRCAFHCISLLIIAMSFHMSL